LDGTPLLLAAEQLDRLATRLGVPPLDSFAESAEVAAEGDDERLADSAGWFDPSEALPTFAALIAAARQPEVAAGFEFAEDLLDELREVERCLRLARDSGARFRLKVL
jgi:hypothetical protein